MLILPRYIIRQLVGPFVFGSSIISFIFILNLLFRELNRILSKGLPLRVVGEFFFYNLAWIFALAVPMATLTACLIAFGRMSADNEITALKASGISLYRIVAPAIFAATLLALVMVWFNNSVLPDFNHRLALLIRDIARKKPTVNLEAGVWYNEFSNYGIIASDIVDSADVAIAHDLIINDYSKYDVSTTIIAKKGYIQTRESEGILELRLFDGEVQEVNIKKPEEFHRLYFPQHIIRIDIMDRFLQRSELSARGDREKSAQMMLDEIKNVKNLAAQNLQTVSSLAAIQMQKYFGSALGLALPAGADSLKLVQKISGTASPVAPRFTKTDKGRMRQSTKLGELPPGSTPKRMLQLRALQEHRTIRSIVRTNISSAKRYNRRIRSLSVEVHKKYSIPVACIIFVLIGAPLGIMARSGSLGVGGGISLGFFLLYWASLIGGEDLADRGYISPFLSMWLANIIVGAFGAYIFFRTVRETTFFRFDFLKRWLQRISKS